MKVPKTIDRLRRNLFRSITRQIGSKTKKQDLSNIDLNKIKKVLIIRPNHRLGNLLLTTPLVQEITTTFPNATIDFLAKGTLAPIVFKNYENLTNFILLHKRPFDNILSYVSIWLNMPFQKYDLIINTVKCSSSGKLLTKITRARYKIYEYKEDENTTSQTIHHAKEAVIAMRTALYGSGHAKVTRAVPMLDIKCSHKELRKGKDILESLMGPTQNIIAIFTFATGDKCYSKKWWATFYQHLLITFPDHQIVEILPYENVSQIDFRATSFYSKDINEMASVMASCKIFIGADSGIMHLACASGVPTLGLFSGRMEQFRPYGKKNNAVDVSSTSMDYWTEKIKGILSPT
ncbi:glycosyltransferase family 9 protein [Nonlabens sp.]|uniref:glycosyltransferase family 9 protein n=1 Tax=Nonlabens sp. TaxID=1888209 RepID=UPI001BCF1067|nr:glycosyltransferase family 9 protein [Nonlabens sp.]